MRHVGRVSPAHQSGHADAGQIAVQQEIQHISRTSLQQQRSVEIQTSACKQQRLVALGQTQNNKTGPRPNAERYQVSSLASRPEARWYDHMHVWKGRPLKDAPDTSTWGSTILHEVEQQKIGIIPYSLDLMYSYWSYRQSANSGFDDC